MKKYKPSPKYPTKLRLVSTIVALLILASGALLGWLISLEEGAGGFWWTVAITAAGDFIWWLPALVLSGPYYRSLSYEVQDDEVIVHVGIFTKSIKHVPYRTVTNLVVKRDIFDRWFFGLGTLNIQTAGMSGQTGAEEQLVGLPNVQEVYDLVATELRRFRGGMAPTAAGVDEDTASAHSVATLTDTVSTLLTEVRAIRQALETRQE